MATEAEVKRSQRRRLLKQGLVSCSVVVPQGRVADVRRLALVESALHRTGAGSALDAVAPGLLAASLARIDLDDPVLPEVTRRALAALCHDLGLVGRPASPSAIVPGDRIRPGRAVPEQPTQAAEAGARVTPATAKRASVPDGWLAPEPGGKRPTAKQAALARALSWHFDLEVPPEAIRDRKVLSAWIQLHHDAWKRDGARQPPAGNLGPEIATEG